MKHSDWMVNLESAAAAVAMSYGHTEVKSILAKYGATTFDNLSPCYYSEIFGELEDRAKDADED